MQVTPYNALRQWNREKDRFPNVKDQEEGLEYLFYVIDRQILFVFRKHPGLVDEEIQQALAIAGLRIVEELDPEITVQLQEFDERVQELADRITACFHPRYHPKTANVADSVWISADDRISHFEAFGSVVRRLIDSVIFWSRRQGIRGYTQYVSHQLRSVRLPEEGDEPEFVLRWR